MLVNNPCTNDSRVIKSAEALQAVGYRVTVIARMSDGLSRSEVVNGVAYKRCDKLPQTKKSFTKVLVSLASKTIEVKNFSVRRCLIGLLASLIILPWSCYLLVSNFLAVVLDFTLSIAKQIAGDFQPPRWIARLIRVNPRTRLKRWLYQFNPGTRLKRWLYQFVAPEEFSEMVCDLAVSSRPHIVHCHDLDTLSAGVRIAKICGAKLIYDSHELEMHRNATYTKLAKLRRQQNELAGIRQANAVITVSESIADHLRDAYTIPRPVVIMNSPDFCEQRSPRVTVRQVIGLDNSSPLAVYVGGVTINRGLEVMVAALTYYPTLHFACVGPRRAETEIKLREMADRGAVLDRLHFIDPVASEDVVGFVSSASVSVLPIQNVCLSYYYCMPNKLFESVFSGLPVVVSNLKDVRAFVERFQCGVVTDETSPTAIANSVRQVIESRERYVANEKKRKQMKAEFGWHAQSVKLKTLYADLLAVPSVTQAR